MLLLFLFGLMIRLVFMPFATHSDLLSMYFRAHLMAVHGFWGLPTNQFLAHLIYSLNLKVMQWVGFDFSQIFLLPFGLNLGSLTASVGDWLRFTALPNINSVLFWLKLPHLLVDTLVFAALDKYFRNHRHRTLILASWWLNPVNIYAFYIFSRHDVFTLAALFLAILFTTRNRVAAAAISLFAAIQIRVQPFLLAPVFAVTWWKNRNNLRFLLFHIIISAAAIGTYMLVVNMLPFDRLAYNQLLEINSDPVSGNSVSVVGIPSRHSQQVSGTSISGIPVFLMLYAIVGGIYLWRGSRQPSEKDRLKVINTMLLLVMTMYFAINPFSPHYFVWLSLYITLAIAFAPKALYGYAMMIVGWMMMGIFDSDVTWFSQNLFTPISNDLFRTPQLPLILQSKFVAASTLFVLGRAVLALGAAYLLFTAVFQEKLVKLKKLVKPLTGIFIFWLGMTAVATGVHAVPAPAVEVAADTNVLSIDELPVGQTFVSPVDTFGAVEIRLGTNRQAGEELFVFRLKEEGSPNWLYEAEYQRNDLYNGYYYPFGFPPVQNAAGKIYYFEISRINHSGLPLQVFTNDNEYASGSLMVGGQPIDDQDLSFVVVSQVSGQSFLQRLKSQALVKYQAQRGFFLFYTLLIGATLGAFILLLVQPLLRRR